MSDATMNPEVTVEEVTPDTVAPKKKGVFRLLALLLLAACAGLFFLDVTTYLPFVGYAENDLLNTLKNLFDKDVTTLKIYGVLPVFFENEGLVATVSNLSFYAMVVFAAIAALCALFALFFGSSRLAVFSACLLTIGCVAYALGVYYVSNCVWMETILDTWTLAIAGAGLFLGFLVKLAKNGNVAWKWLLQVVLVLGAAYLALTALTEEYKNLPFDTDLAEIAYYLVGGLVFVALVVFLCKKAYFLTALLAFAMAAAILCLTLFTDDVKGDMLYAILAVAATALLLITTFFKHRKEKEPALAEEVDEAPVEEYRKETFVEAYAYDGGPVAGVQLAEEVYPTVAAIEAQKDPEGTARNTVASLLGNGFDPFLIMLNDKEKEEFIDLYILRCKGQMSEIPGYVVGGNNKEFFNCIFIYLGQYREKMSATLLEKMYKFSMKI